ncbi:304c17e9-557f-49a5-93ef-64b29e142d23 [Thermothielavioides terrestris]|uniref:304c17e9-557f-49a5-93ef-64b29e142d23 n=1 Tax=Thermothielavioides terrestris TaxID=2587410 RepID=A0A446BG91_9PEZI|nr:304c17e9-557f-49a5-93ef-64b29e142d23 [Thermothielavioides terrestris]
MAAQSPNPALDGESRVTEIVVILSVASVFSTLAVTLRCYSRGVILRSFGLDDAIMVPAQILTLASAVAIGLEAKYGLGRHAWTMPEENLIPYMKASKPGTQLCLAGLATNLHQAFYSSIVVYNIAVCMTKISILLQYRRIFNNTALRKFIIFGLAFLTCWGITLSLLLPSHL